MMNKPKVLESFQPHTMLILRKNAENKARQERRQTEGEHRLLSDVRDEVRQRHCWIYHQRLSEQMF